MRLQFLVGKGTPPESRFANPQHRAAPGSTASLASHYRRPHPPCQTSCTLRDTHILLWFTCRRSLEISVGGLRRRVPVRRDAFHLMDFACLFKKEALSTRWPGAAPCAFVPCKGWDLTIQRPQPSRFVIPTGVAGFASREPQLHSGEIVATNFTPPQFVVPPNIAVSRIAP
jgi:hypothetical protein